MIPRKKIMILSELIEKLNKTHDNRKIKEILSNLAFETRFNYLRELIYHIDIYMAEGKYGQTDELLTSAEKLENFLNIDSRGKISDKVRTLQIITKKKRAKFFDNQGMKRRAIAQYKLIISELQLPRENNFLAELLMEIGIIEEQLGYKQEAFKKFGKAVKVYGRQKDKFNYEAAMFNCAHVLYDLRFFRKAEEFCRALIDHYRKTGKMQSPIAHAYLEMANIRELKNQGDGARAYYKKALDAYRHLDDKSKMSDILNRIGTFEMEDGNIKSAVNIYQEALGIKTSLDYNTGQATFYENMGDSLRFANNLNDALKYYKTAYHYYQVAGAGSRKIILKHKIHKILSFLGLEDNDLGTYIESYKNQPDDKGIIKLEKIDYNQIPSDEVISEVLRDWKIPHQFKGNRKFLIFLLRNLSKAHSRLENDEEYLKFHRLRSIVEKDFNGKKNKNS
ncbi:MAG: tetratricopeptide repeat protein [Vulcanimicrobiota bacterium]